jgi:hypothetical protein
MDDDVVEFHQFVKRNQIQMQQLIMMIEFLIKRIYFQGLIVYFLTRWY